jgi:hypothetical protein
MLVFFTFFLLREEQGKQTNKEENKMGGGRGNCGEFQNGGNQMSSKIGFGI